jgi:hypothetical protein
MSEATAKRQPGLPASDVELRHGGDLEEIMRGSNMREHFQEMI